MSADSIRFAVFAPNMAGGGAERAALQLAAGLTERGFTTDLVLAAAEGPRMAEVPDGVEVVDLGAQRVLTSLPALVRYLRRAKPDAMVSVLDHANIVALWARRLAGYPKQLAVVEQNNLSQAAKHGKSRRDRMMPRIANRFYPWADYVVGVSEGVIDDLRLHVKTVPDDRFRVIYNPIVTPELLEMAGKPPTHPWVDRGEPVFVAAGRLRPQKNFPMLLQAFKRVRSERPARLIILGEGPDRGQLETLIESLALEDDVDLHGYDSNPYAYYSRSTAFVLSSLWEGLPTVLIEALSCGAPVIATDCPNGPKEILDNGRHGRLVPVGDADTFASAMGDALDGKVEPPQEESWRPYTVERVVDDYVELFKG